MLMAGFSNLASSFLKGLGSLVLVVWGVATATFLLMIAIPGGPLSRDRELPPQVREAIEARYHLDESRAMQYVRSATPRQAGSDFPMITPVARWGR
jgi:ABC-type dipeptide/oligopeptide/nickel transport system permease component